MKNQDKKEINITKVSRVCAIIAIAICLVAIVCEFFMNKKVEIIWIVLLLSNTVILNANRCKKKQKKIFLKRKNNY